MLIQDQDNMSQIILRRNQIKRYILKHLNLNLRGKSITYTRLGCLNDQIQYFLSSRMSVLEVMKYLQPLAELAQGIFYIYRSMPKAQRFPVKDNEDVGPGQYTIPGSIGLIPKYHFEKNKDHIDVSKIGKF